MSAAATTQPLVVRLPLAAIASAPDGPPPPCGHCGGRGVNVHQRAWRQIKDPYVTRALVVRYLCKHCGRARRAYPTGIDAGRQSVTLRQLSLLLYWIGLSYQQVCIVLAELGCPLSTTSVRRNVEAVRAVEAIPPPLDRLRLTALGGGRLRGADGDCVLRLRRSAPSGAELEVAVAPGRHAAELCWRFTTCADWLGSLPEPAVLPPASA